MEALKAYVITAKDDNSETDIVAAKSANRAKYASNQSIMGIYSADYVDLRAKRVKAFDKYITNSMKIDLAYRLEPSYEDLIKNNFIIDCMNCGCTAEDVIEGIPLCSDCIDKTKKAGKNE